MSLRARVVLLVVGLTAALLGGLWAALAGSFSGWSAEALEADLAARAEGVAAAVEVERDGRLEIEGDDLPFGRDPGRPFRVLGPDGFAWASRRFPWGPPAEAWSAPGSAVLADAEGHRWRVVTRSFTVAGEHRREPAGILVQVAGEEAPFVALGHRFRKGLLLAVLAALALGGAGAALLVHRSLRPLRRLAAEVDAIGAHTLDRRVDTAGLDPELSRLGAAFNDLLGRLAGAMQRQRRLVSRASHGLRTPAATILTQAEVALRRDRTPGEYRQALAEIAGTARESAALIAHLLALARLEEREGPPRCEPLDAAEVAGEVLRLLGPRAEEAGIALAAEVPQGLSVWAERAGLRELLEALLDNAVAYTPRGGRAGIRAVGAPGGGVDLEVWDTGPGIPPEERAQVRERFSRGSAAEGKPGSGLGLAIAEAIASAHGASLELLDRPGGGLLARVRFPPPSA